jgi:phosphoribosylformylglycinamidine synthase I
VQLIGEDVEYVWHSTTRIKDIDCLILPGGFSYGDYLRTGAIARFSPVMKAINDFIQEGGLVIGICNGFQILLEAGILPGAMLKNKGLKFVCRYVDLKVENNRTPFTNTLSSGAVIRVPIAHNEGNYFVDDKTLQQMKRNNQIVLRYSEPDGQISTEANPNGALQNIAGIVNEKGNVFGLMPHPERAMEHLLGSTDGKQIFQSIINWID